MLKKLRKRFICINMAIITGMLLIIFGLILHFTNIDLENKSDKMLQQLAQYTLDPIAPQLDAQLPYFTLRFNIQGEVVASGKIHYDISDRTFLDEILKEVSKQKNTTGYLEDYGLKYTIVTSPTVRVIAFVDVSSHYDTMLTLAEISILIGIVALATFAFISIILARWSAAPVDRAWKQQKQFVSDASHELKTPLTVIISNAELLQNIDNNSESARQLTDNILASSSQMRRLVDGLLELARADNGQIRNNFENIDLSKIVSDSILPFEPVFYESGSLLQSTVEPDIYTTGNSQYLHQLVDILLDNARKYGVKGIVDISLRRTSRSQCLLTVSSPGNPIPPEHQENIFNRFYRIDAAHSNDGSFGLGLSIAKQIVTEHQGEIWVESNPSGNCFHILLPCHT